ncbi:DUF6498-containing protein [Halogeometricum pallidum]|uniref:DUF6498-containing protein n=1 Tax=Halogeometricum pallidum TaxID=411361 RepID=UPI0006782C22|nr:DUF6498-containing protein [Halogeometricum pallidum]
MALGALLAANLVPLVGVLALGWNVFDVLAVYWVESGVVGLLNVPKILLASGPYDGSATFTLNGRPMDVSGPKAVDPDAGPTVHPENAFPALFFCAHYGIFWVVHGVFVLFGLPAFAGASVGGLDVSGIALAGLTMLVSHGGSFLWNYLGRGEFRDASAVERMTEPYRRVFVLHLTVVIGATLVASLGGAAVLVVLMVTLKTGFDAVAHLREHRRAQ